MKYLYLIPLLLLAGCTNKKQEDPKPAANKPAEILNDSLSFTQSKENKEEFHAFIVSHENGSVKLDPVEYLTSESKNIPQAVKKEVEQNGFSLRNTMTDAYSLPFGKECEIVMQTYSNKPDGSFNQNQKITINDFTKLMSSPKWNRYKNVPFLIQITGVNVTSIKEIYIP